MKKFFAIFATVIICIFVVLLDFQLNGVPNELASFFDNKVAPSSTILPEVTLEPTREPTTKPTQISNSHEPIIITTATPETKTTPEPIVIVTMAPTATPIPETSGNMEIHQINVGCADAYLIKSGDIAIMVDGGLSESRTKVLNYLRNNGVSQLTAYIATHWHGDHVQNMNAILNEFGTSETIVFGPSKNISSSVSIPNGKGQYMQMADGNTFDFADIHIKCMGPYKVQQSGECNYDSLNFLITFGETKLFMTGDYVHKEVLDSYQEELKDINVYKMAHHGLKVSDMNGSPEVLSVLNPDIILVPANSSQPTSNLISKLRISASVYNNKSGNVVITTDGLNVTVSTEK